MRLHWKVMEHGDIKSECEISLWVWDRFDLIYFHRGYAGYPGQLETDLSVLRSREEDPRQWDGNDFSGMSFSDRCIFYDKTVNDPSTRVIADHFGPVSRDAMSPTGRRIFYPDSK